MLVLLIMTFAVIGLIEVPDLIKKKYWRELVAYSIFLMIGFILSLLLTLGVETPSPALAIKYLVKDLLHLNYR